MDKDILFAGISDEWLEILDGPLLDEVIKALNEHVAYIKPPQNKVFEFARLTELSNVKVVILGQDPYPRAGDAHGLAFSCLTNVPASLNNIYKCLLHHKLIENMPASGDLSYWARQGVLLLNCALTMGRKSNDHADIWESYTNQLICSIINERQGPLIFMLWGGFAKTRKNLILTCYNNSKRENKEQSDVHILEWAHPSPMAQATQSFIPCDHFIRANKILGNNAIDWHQAEPVDKVSKGFEMTERKTVIFTDGSAYPNKAVPESVAGYAVSFALGCFAGVTLYGNINNTVAFATNQRAEGMAILRTFEFLLARANEWDECVIVSDSDFWIQMIQVYMPNWSRHDAPFEEKKNPDLTIPIWRIYNTLTQEHSKTIEFRHMKSHDKDGWSKTPEDSYEYFCYTQNNYVDELANYARQNVDVGVDLQGSSIATDDDDEQHE